MKRFAIKLVITLFTFIVGICAVWISYQQTNSTAPIVKNGDINPPSPTIKDSLLLKEISNARSLCNRISEIKYLHPKNETGYDEIYDALIKADESVVGCLIEKITDTTIMPDPRGTRISQEIKVGDVAYFVLIDIKKLDFVEMLPEKVKQKYKTEGAYAYHDYIERRGSRKQLKEMLLTWYAFSHTK